jgi:hypothetical protein
MEIHHERLTYTSEPVFSKDALMEGIMEQGFDAAIQVQIDKSGHFIISEQSIQAIAEAVVEKLAKPPGKGIIYPDQSPDSEGHLIS